MGSGMLLCRAQPLFDGVDSLFALVIQADSFLPALA
jgi:hypothetical protein